MATYTPYGNAKLNQAMQFAIMSHGNQVRKGNEHIPYVFHPFDVANEVIYHSGLPIPELEKAAILAILHDVVEDTIAEERDVRAQFGDEIADGVLGLSKNPNIDNGNNPDSKLKQLEENLARLIQQPKYVQVVKLADRVSNLKSFPAMWSKDKVAQYLTESLLIARTLGESSEGLQARLLSRIVNARVTLSIMM